MPTRLFSATPSRLLSWVDCPRRYRLTYVDRPAPAKGPPWAHNSVGAAVHSALAGWWSLPAAQRTPLAGARLVHECWLPTGFRDSEQADAWRDRAAAMVERYVATLDPDDEPVGVERTVALRTPAVALSGRIDRLDRRDDELVVVDYKTGRHVLSTDDARGSLALAVYAMGAARTLRSRCLRVELHHLPTGRVVVWEHSGDSLRRQLDRVHDIAAEIVAAGAAATDPDEAYPMRPGRQCGWCDLAAHCPAGRSAPRSTSWAGLADDLVAPEEITPAVDLEVTAERESAL